MKLPKLIFIFLVFGATVTFIFAPGILNRAKALLPTTAGDGDTLNTTPISQSQIDLSWTCSFANTDIQTIYRCLGSTCTPAYLDTVAAGTCDYSSTGLSCGNTYRFQVDSAYGATNISTNTTDQCTPGTPTIETATPASQTTATVNWTRGSPTTETGFQIYDDSSNDLVGSAGAGATSGTAGGQSCNTTNAYLVRAYVDTNGRRYFSDFSAYSNYVTTDQCTPGTPTIGTATATGQTTATVNWTRNSPYTESGFYIYDSNGTYWGSASAGATSTSISGLTCGTSYSFKVEAYVNTNGRTYYSSFSALSNTITTSSQSTSGTLISSIFDTTKTSGANLNSIIWQGSQPAGTCVEFQIAVSNTSTGPWEYKGCDSYGCAATTGSYYGASCPGPNVAIPIYDRAQVKNQRYLRYKATLISDVNQTVSPTIEDIILNWSP